MTRLQFDVPRGLARWARAAVAAAVLAAPLARASGQAAPAPVPRSTSVTPQMPAGCWRVWVTPDAPGTPDGRLEYEEYVTFEGATFTGRFLARLGFSPGTLTLGTDSLGQTTFAATLTSATQGTIVASGVLQATTMSGTFNWSCDGKTVVYNFTGTPHTPAVRPQT